jgi:hypothetical protein
MGHAEFCGRLKKQEQVPKQILRFPTPIAKADSKKSKGNDKSGSFAALRMTNGTGTLVDLAGEV